MDIIVERNSQNIKISEKKFLSVFQINNIKSNQRNFFFILIK